MSGYGLVQEKKQTPYRLDAISIFVTFWAATIQLLLLLASTDLNVINGVYKYMIFFAGFTALIVILRPKGALNFGPVLSIVNLPSGWGKFEAGFISIPFTYALIGAIQTIILNYGPTLSLYIANVSAYFYTTGGALEEWMFTFVLLAYLLEHMPAWAAVIIKSAIFTVYHTFVYGLNSPTITTIYGVTLTGWTWPLVAVFGSTLALAVQYKYTKRLWPNQFVHMIVNYTVGP